MADKLSLFFSSYALWSRAVLAGVVCGAVCGFTGVYVILHRIVFVSAAMSQVSSLGVMVAFWLAQFTAVDAAHHTEDVMPIALAALFTGTFSLAVAKGATERLADRSKSSEAFIGAVYLLSTAALLLIGDRITQGAHDVSNVLFGNAVTVDAMHLGLLLVVALPVLLAHAWLRKDLVFISFDPAMAVTLGYPVRRLRAFLLISLGVVISIGTRTIGAMPVFSFSVLAPMAALALFSDTRRSFYASALLGACAAGLGYVISFLFSVPTGAAMVGVGGMVLIAAKTVKRMSP